MKALSFLILVLFLAMATIAKRVPKISREKFNKIVPKLLAKLALRMQVQAGLLRSKPASSLKADKDEGECLDALTSMITSNANGSLLNFLLYSFKGLNDLGDYKGCTSTKGSRYIMLMLKISDGTPSSGNFGICGPSQCRAEHYLAYLKPILMDVLVEIMEYLDLPDSGFFGLTDESVRFIDVDEKNAELGTIGPLGVLLIIFGIIALVAGIYLTYMDYKLTGGKFSGSTGHQVVECCSLVRNAKSLFYGKNPVDINLEILNGIRVLSMCWVICGHTFDYFNVSPIANVLDITDYIENNYAMQTIVAGTFSIDVFFFMSGFLCALTMTAQFARIKNPRDSVKAVFVAYAHRYIRLLPLYLLAMLLTIGLVPYLFSDGPLAVFNEWQMNICTNKWWHNLLYIQNYTKIGEGCLIWSWYLANDMQLFLITPWIIILFNWNKKRCLQIIAAICVASVIIQICVVWHYDLSTSYFYVAKGEFFEDYYVRPYNRINAYLLGIVFAWAYFAWKDKKNEGFIVNQWTRKWVDNVYLKYTLIFIGIGITYTCVSLQYVFDHYWQDIQTWHNVLYIIVSRPMFVIGLLLVVYPAMLGKEKILFTILGAPFWNALAKLTYGAYMFHVIILIAEKSGEYHSTYYTIMRVVFFSIHIWVLSYLLSLLLSLFIEIPIGQLEKTYLFPRRREAVNALGKDKEGVGKTEKLLATKGDTKDEIKPSPKREETPAA